MAHRLRNPAGWQARSVLFKEQDIRGVIYDEICMLAIESYRSVTIGFTLLVSAFFPDGQYLVLHQCINAEAKDC